MRKIAKVEVRGLSRTPILRGFSFIECEADPETDMVVCRCLKGEWIILNGIVLERAKFELTTEKLKRITEEGFGEIVEDNGKIYLVFGNRKYPVGEERGGVDAEKPELPDTWIELPVNRLKRIANLTKPNKDHTSTHNIKVSKEGAIALMRDGFIIDESVTSPFTFYLPKDFIRKVLSEDRLYVGKNRNGEIFIKVESGSVILSDTEGFGEAIEEVTSSVLSSPSVSGVKISKEELREFKGFLTSLKKLETVFIVNMKVEGDKLSAQAFPIDGEPVEGEIEVAIEGSRGSFELWTYADSFLDTLSIFNSSVVVEKRQYNDLPVVSVFADGISFYRVALSEGKAEKLLDKFNTKA